MPQFLILLRNFGAFTCAHVTVATLTGNTYQYQDRLDAPADVPIVMCDARTRDSVKMVLISLVRYVLNTRSQPS
jgi:hypothetical protein